jgi:ankyrin repeat protein
MKINIQIIFTILIFNFIGLNFIRSQEENIFFDRDFWKSKPSIDKIDSCIEAGHSPSDLDRFAFDATTWAIIEDNSDETVKHLISIDGNDVNKKTHDGRTYIFWAMYRDNLKLMNYLHQQGAKTDIIDSHGYSLMNFGAVTGQLNTELYDFCIENGAIVKDQKNNDGANPLLLLSPFMEDEKLINYFTEKGIDINKTDNNGNGIFNYAAKRGNQTIMNLLIEKGINYKELNKINGNAMIFASYGMRKWSNSLATYKYLDSLGIEPNITTSKGVNPLHSIVYKVKDIDIINFFIDNEVDVNQENIKGFNVLMNSCYSNDTSVISYLINLTKNINHKNNEGKTALTIAVSNNSFEAVKLLVENGANINVSDSMGNSLMYYLLKFSSKSKMELLEKKMNYLIKKGIAKNKIQANGNTLFHIIVDKNNVDLIEKIKDFEIDINSRNENGLTALHFAAMKGENTELILKLISLGANKNIKTSFGETAFDLAKENELLIKSKVNIEFLNPKNE